MEAVDDYCVEGRQRFPRDYTRTTTMGQVVEQGGSWTPGPPSKERERESERERVSLDGGASISPSHRNGCHDRKVSQPPFKRNFDEGWPFEDQRRAWIDETASIQFIRSDFIVARAPVVRPSFLSYK